MVCLYYLDFLTEKMLHQHLLQTACPRTTKVQLLASSSLYLNTAVSSDTMNSACSSLVFFQKSCFCCKTLLNVNLFIQFLGQENLSDALTASSDTALLHLLPFFFFCFPTLKKQEQFYNLLIDQTDFWLSLSFFVSRYLSLSLFFFW